MKTTLLERYYVGIMRLNKLLPGQEITKKFSIGRLEITFNWRSRKNLWGRFGGGWNWELGFQIGSTTVIVNLLIFSLRFYLKKKERSE
jgi:hypothetical protein